MSDIVPARQRASGSFANEKSRNDSVESFFSKKREEVKKEESKKEAAPRVKQWSPKDRRRARKRWVLIGGVAGAVLVCLLLLSTVFARVSVSVEPLVERGVLPPTSVAITPDAHAIDPARGIIPGEIIEFSEARQLQFRATGKKFVEAKARGTITISNGYSSQPQVLVSGTRFMSDSGKIYKLEKGITVPGAVIKNGAIVPSDIDAALLASEGGAAYNSGPTNLKIMGFKGTPRYQAFTVRSGGFSGGLVGDSAVATDSDIKSASEAATADLFNFLKDTLATRTPDGFTVIEGAREISITKVDTPSVGTPGDQFTLTVSGRVRAMAFRKSDEDDFISALFSSSTPRVLIPEKSKLERRAVALDMSQKQLSYTLAGGATVGARLDPDKIKNDFVGKTPDGVEETLRQYKDVRGYRIKFFPFWLWHAPGDPDKINISIEPFQP